MLLVLLLTGGACCGRRLGSPEDGDEEGTARDTGSFLSEEDEER